MDWELVEESDEELSEELDEELAEELDEELAEELDEESTSIEETELLDSVGGRREVVGDTP